uniref:helix-turn-helix domain-containing protein n=1 Tax=Mesorhizobium sp. LHD-90 TaxID=3071414 RepID=UPI0035A86C6A
MFSLLPSSFDLRHSTLATRTRRRSVRRDNREKVLEPPLSERHAALRLGVSVDTLQRIRKRNEISYRKIGGRVRYTLADLREFVERTKVEACEKKTSGSVNSRGTTSPSGSARHSFTPLGSIRQPGKPSAHLLAQRTFGKPKSV